VESRNAVTFFEFDDIVTDLVDDARDIVALVGVVVIGEPACGLVNFFDLPDIQRTRYLPGTFQSLGLLPLYTTLMTTWSAPALGMGVSTMLTLGPVVTRASFMLFGW
jgi:hypothetical protein